MFMLTLFRSTMHRDDDNEKESERIHKRIREISTCRQITFIDRSDKS